MFFNVFQVSRNVKQTVVVYNLITKCIHIKSLDSEQPVSRFSGELKSKKIVQQDQKYILFLHSMVEYATSSL